MTTVLTRSFFGLMALFLAMPIIVIAGVALNEKKTLAFPPQGLSADWYLSVFTDEGWRSALMNSVLVAAVAAAISVAIALPLAWFLWRRVAPWARLVEVIGFSPFILPPVITALGALSFWATTGFYGQPWTVVISHGIFFVSLPLVTITLGFATIDREIIEAGMTMGADDKTLLKTVIFPLIRPYVISGFAFAFVLSLNEYIVAYMTVGFTLETIPIKVFNALRYGYTPTMAAVSVFFILVAIAVFGLVARFGDLPKLLGAWSEGEKD
ncbi:putative spermidine/putrescine transport system permease protein [Roseibium hamelinense]|uniref:Putative spermidine/putrescine transport system permease protein n=1 Tax=Roseibium hamelinense TaxID=150831 RepID=A0A562TIQ1_9HYPH|nr:ABC transporter permease [Roseibium hamelinense]MTI43141.1 ABC transporter permease [Roseibium hamelinense]TWI92510.1 putative spermidine/putrescine transport system permease protein [Roseibium hamelinense]